MEKTKIDPRVIELKGRLFNILKMRERLLIADAILRPIAQLWIVAAVLICAPYAYDPMIYPIYWGFIVSVVIFATYYGLIGTVRRSTEVYLEKLAATYGYDLTKGSLGELQQKLDIEKPFRDSDDPAIVKNIFAIAKLCFLPRRGLIQQTVVMSQIIFLGYYVYNYAHFFGGQTLNYFPNILWQMHAAVTLFGIIMMVKNASFLITSRFFLALTNMVLDPRGSGRRVSDRIADAESTHAAIKSAMEEYRFNGDIPPPSNECGTCIKGMAIHVVGEVPLILATDPRDS